MVFARCAQMDPPAAGSTKLGSLTVRVEERNLFLDHAEKLRIAAFSGPVSGVFSHEEVQALRESKPSLIVWLGGLGASEREASENLSAVAELGILTLFIPQDLPICEAFSRMWGTASSMMSFTSA